MLFLVKLKPEFSGYVLVVYVLCLLAGKKNTIVVSFW